MHIQPNFTVIVQTRAKTWRFLDFLHKMAAVRHLGFFVCQVQSHVTQKLGQISKICHNKI